MMINLRCPEIFNHIFLEVFGDNASQMISMMCSILSECQAELDDILNVQIVGLRYHVVLPIFQSVR